MAVNLVPAYTLDEWRAWLRRYTEQSLVWAQDTEGKAAAAFRINALGVKVIIDRDGRISYRSAGLAGYDTLDAAVKEVL